MTMRRDVRRCAVQVLYLYDSGTDASAEELLASLAGSPGDDLVHHQGLDLAARAWDVREDADRAVSDLAPQWPTHRQPMLDRAILRLAYFEIASGLTPPKVVINEAVELAKEYSTERSPMFINGVLDKLYRTLREASVIPSDGPGGDAGDRTGPDET